MIDYQFCANCICLLLIFVMGTDESHDVGKFIAQTIGNDARNFVFFHHVILKHQMSSMSFLKSKFLPSKLSIDQLQILNFLKKKELKRNEQLLITL